ncbi:RNA polymerase sigma factor [Amycolatopsis sp. ATCC 39116]|uniref:RNA polymerase sigma factor n=1 Tax=Amycolatopsis sp. (strain ATCC 39116 / 75iv2) TaxID=385957 RepID=UPI000A00F757|nr:RNA polymerase sigma factor [Amycolatopsis sp. ATCC 39116]
MTDTITTLSPREAQVLNSPHCSAVGRGGDVKHQWPIWVSQAQAGNRAALETLAAQLLSVISGYCRPHRYALRAAGSSTDDVVQDVWLSVQTGLDRYEVRGDVPFLAWVHTITTRRIADVQRGAAKRPVILNHDDLQALPLVTDGAADVVERRWQQQQISRVLQTMVPRRREALLCHVLGENDREIARRWSSSPVSIRVARHKAMAALRGRLAHQADGDGGQRW